MTNETIPIHCNSCGTEKQVKPTPNGNARLPRGWKRSSHETLCKDCKDDRYRLRAVTIPVAAPLSCGWPKLRKLLQATWSESTRCANWMWSELYARDVRREPGVEKMPKWNTPYLYPETAEFELPSQSRAAMEQAIKGKYRSKRFAIIWTRAESLTSVRYPYPYSVPNQSWKVRFGEDEEGCDVPIVSLPLIGGRVELRLRGGKDYRRQLSAFRQIVEGKAIKGECVLYRKRVSESDGRNGMSSNDASRPQYRIMCKMVAYLPQPSRRKPGGTRLLSLRTDTDSFLYGVLENREEPWLLHADHVRDWTFQHARRLQRMADDSKYERRRPKRRRKIAKRDYADLSVKHRNRMETFIKQTVAQIAGFAERNRVTKIKYDDSETGYLLRFQWFAFRESLAIKCKEIGVEFAHANGEVESKDPHPLAIDKGD